MEAGNPLEVQQSLPPSHSTLIKDIVWIPREELLSIMQCCNIPIHSWVHILFGSFKDNITYILCIKDSSVSALVVPWLLPYHPDPQSPSNGQSIFDMDLARGHGLEVTISTSDWGHPIAYCEGKEYYYGCSRIYFPMKWVKVLNGGKMETLDRAVTNRQVMVLPTSHVSLTTYIFQEPHNQLQDDPLTSQNCIQPGDFIHIASGPHKGLCGMLHWYSGCEILITPSTLQQADPDNLGDKGKSKAQEPKVPSGDGDINEGSDLVQVSVSMDEALIIPPSTLQFSRERGYDVTIVLSDDGPLHDVLIGFCIKLENHSLRDVERQVGHEVWIISGPKKGYRGMLQSVSRTYCNVAIESGIMQLKNTAVITEFGMCLNGAILDST
ncbi:hypothetical protein EDC04DRAFT_2613356 [Pisolithus marmoratus]|nr:hypothetical protein EDC04DRAFT_2613356 [Pisolithus marmoratus]